MAKGAVEDGAIRNVVLRPKVFTPANDPDGYFGNIRLSFEFDNEYDGYEVYIFDLRGNVVKDFKREGRYIQGEVAWDGLDFDGFPVKSGVYIYRVVAGGEVYAGTVIIAR